MIYTFTLEPQRQHIKAIKTVLQTRALLEPLKIEHHSDGHSTVIAVWKADHDEGKFLLELQHLSGEGRPYSLTCIADEEYEGQHSPPPLDTQNRVTRVTTRWLDSLSQFQNTPQVRKLALEANASVNRYQVYPPMLLFSAGAFESKEWTALYEMLHRTTDKPFETLFQEIAEVMGVTHIAVNAPIPAKSSHTGEQENTVRSPLGLKPLYGDFSPLIDGPPSQANFEDAFWVSTVQNGIKQIWAPYYTMFSRGNTVEKTRLLSLSSVTEAVAQGRRTSRGCSVVDLYAGIGYFALSYARAGVNKVLCFDINPWSIEGLRRGAEANRWRIGVFNEEIKNTVHAEQAITKPTLRLLAFQMSNDLAGGIVEKYRDRLPPMRHVNCGLLPSSRNSWPKAVKIVDPKEGGWIHVHENIAISDIEGQSQCILQEFRDLVRSERPQSNLSPVLEHVQKVKTYAPGVMHYVLDIYIPPSNA